MGMTQSQRKKEFLDTLITNTGSVSKTLKETRVAVRTFENWRATDQAFDEKYLFVKYSIAEEVEQRLLEISMGRTNCTGPTMNGILKFLSANIPERYNPDKNIETYLENMFLRFVNFVMQQDKELGIRVAEHQISFLENTEVKQIMKTTK